MHLYTDKLYFRKSLRIQLDIVPDSSRKYHMKGEDNEQGLL